MIPILYDSSETSFTTNGLGRLAECISCIVTEERNGVYECEFQYPVTGRMYSQITEGRIVAVTHDDKGDLQPFDIYGRTAPIDGVVTFHARHISYRLKNVILKPFTAGSCAEALSKFETETYNLNPFSFWTDKSVTSTYTVKAPSSAREMLGGVQGSILDVYGKGEYEFDKFTVKLHLNRGTDSGVTVRYGINLIDLTREIDTGDVYNTYVPYWLSADGDTLVMLPEIFVLGASASMTDTPWTTDGGDNMEDGSGNVIYFRTSNMIMVPLDMSEAFEEEPTVAQLRSAAQSRINNSEAYVPKDTIEVDFVALWQTKEYSQYAALQRLGLCDKVTVIYPQLGVNAKMQIVHTEYNVLTDRFDKMELGSARSSFADLVVEQIGDTVLKQYAGKSMMTAAISHATDLITGGLGGYVVFTLNADNQPEEILIMDTPDTSTAVNVWRFNKNGLGHSSNGYNGPFNDIALTADGQINASMITTGTLLANVIKAGVLSDYQNRNSWNLDTGTLTINGGTINLGGSRGFFVGSYGDVAIGEKPADMSSFDDNQTAFQTNIWGQVKMTAMYMYGRESASDNYSRYAFFKGLLLGILENGTLVNYVGLTIQAPNTGGTLVDCLHVTAARTEVMQDFVVYGTKNRAVKTSTYGTRKLAAYETAEPYFGDIGEDVIGHDGRCVVRIDPIFRETIGGRYQVFLTPYGRGECFVAERREDEFIVEGNGGLRFGWEIKGRQIDYQDNRLEAVE